MPYHIVGEGAVRPPVVEAQQRPLQRRAARHAHVDLVAGDRRLAKCQAAADVAQLLLRLQRGLAVEQAEAVGAARRALDAGRVVQQAPEHLVAAAKSDQLAAVAEMTADRRLVALRAQPGEIGLHRLLIRAGRRGRRRAAVGRGRPSGSQFVDAGAAGRGRCALAMRGNAGAATLQPDVGAALAVVLKRIFGIEEEAVQVGQRAPAPACRCAASASPGRAAAGRCRRGSG